MLTIVVVGVAAFVLSFTTLRDLAVLAHIPSEWAWCLPVVIDGTIIQATLGVLVLAASPERRWFMWVLGVGAVVSIAGNSLHAVAAGRELPWQVAALVAAIAPISLLVDTHGLAVLVRAAQPIPVPEPAAVEETADRSEQVPVPEPEPVPEPAPVPVREPVRAVPVAPLVPPTAPPIRPVTPVRPIHPARPVQEALPLAIS
ncbi:DUF2637 domain-containing protein [Nocardia brasiliensis]|uniref:DUF2637 domain-containing protein n=1 Tax=Nocardia brasiliensis TaxID=37326 RepID=UPI0024541CF7|nr:DUF2637 domain-containing protein [Nocardia brasiliensis]